MTSRLCAGMPLKLNLQHSTMARERIHTVLCIMGFDAIGPIENLWCGLRFFPNLPFYYMSRLSVEFLFSILVSAEW